MRNDGVVRIYTDGGCAGNQNEENLGGWGAILEFVKDGEDTEKNGKHTQKYKSREVYGYETRYSILETEEGKNGRVSLTHYYRDTQGAGTNSWKYVQIANRMREKYGRPKEMKDMVVEGYSWSEGNGGYMLYAIAGMIVVNQWQSD